MFALNRSPGQELLGRVDEKLTRKEVVDIADLNQRIAQWIEVEQSLTCKDVQNIWQALGPSIAKFRFCGQDIEDLIQDTLYAAWTNRDHYNPKLGNPLIWLKTIILRKAINLYRQRKNDQRLVCDLKILASDKVFWSEDETESWPSPAKQTQLLALQQAWAELSMRDQEILGGNPDRDRKQARELADRFGLTTKALRARRCYLTRRLHKKLAGLANIAPSQN